MVERTGVACSRNCTTCNSEFVYPQIEVGKMTSESTRMIACFCSEFCYDEWRRRHADI